MGPREAAERGSEMDRREPQLSTSLGLHVAPPNQLTNPVNDAVGEDVLLKTALSCEAMGVFAFRLGP